MGAAGCAGMRIDRLLVYLRLARTRSRASFLVDSGHMRCNGQHITRTSAEIHVGDVLTLMVGKQVKIIEVLSMPDRRGPPEMARSHYRELDRNTKTAIADDQHCELKGKTAT